MYIYIAFFLEDVDILAGECFRIGLAGVHVLSYWAGWCMLSYWAHLLLGLEETRLYLHVSIQAQALNMVSAYTDIWAFG